MPDPVYPVYVDTNVMAGRTGICRDGRYEGLIYLESTEANGFVPALPDAQVDLIYLCFPNNPTGATATRAQLQLIPRATLHATAAQAATGMPLNKQHLSKPLCLPPAAISRQVVVAVVVVQGPPG